MAEKGWSAGHLGLIKRFYRKLPVSLRGLAAVHRAKAIVQSYLLPHDWVYDGEYYSEAACATSAASASAIADSVVRDLKPARVIDVGCGSGDLLAALRDRGCEVFGLERSQWALKICHSKNLEVAKFNLESDEATMESAFDVAISLEVAEHLPASVAERYVDLLKSLAPRVVFSAAAPGQVGTDHINEQPPEYWQTKFEKRGLQIDEVLSARWREEWRHSPSVARWYWQNLMVFGAKDGEPS